MDGTHDLSMVGLGLLSLLPPAAFDKATKSVLTELEKKCRVDVKILLERKIFF